MHAPSGLPLHPPFDPPEHQAAAILSALSTGRATLPDLAQAHDTTLEALCCWMHRPDIHERLLAIESAAILAARLAASALLPTALDALSDLLASRAAESAAITLHATGPRAAALHQRQSTHVRRTAGAILHLTRLQPLARAPRPARPAHAPTPAASPDPAPAPALAEPDPPSHAPSLPPPSTPFRSAPPPARTEPPSAHDALSSPRAEPPSVNDAFSSQRAEPLSARDPLSAPRAAPPSVPGAPPPARAEPRSAHAAPSSTRTAPPSAREEPPPPRAPAAPRDPSLGSSSTPARSLDAYRPPPTTAATFTRRPRPSPASPLLLAAGTTLALPRPP